MSTPSHSESLVSTPSAPALPNPRRRASSARGVTAERIRRLAGWALAAPLALALSACSGAEPTSLDRNGDSLPCCSGGYIYTCANEAALDRCSQSGETIDCTKTARTCGGGGAATPTGGTSPDTPDASTSSGSSGSGRGNGGGSSTPPRKREVGETCGAAEECAGGQCLVYGEQATTGFCSKVCITRSDCPSRFLCELQTKIGAKVCIPQGEKQLGETCTLAVDCESGLCLTTGSATLGYCTAQCTVPAECPANWTCATVSGASGRFCQRQ